MSQSTIFGQDDAKWRLSCAYLCAACFILGIGLAGASQLSGVFYALSIAFSLPLLNQISWRNLSISDTARNYIFIYVLIIILYCIHIIALGRDLDNLDNISRVGLGFMNGAFFLAFFRHERQSLFSFLVLLAAVHSAIAVAVSLWQGIDFSTFALSGVRTGGVTNPIPFSQLLMASLGIVTIYGAGRLHEGNAMRRGIALLVLVGIGILGAALTGTRGTMLAVVLLAVLAFANGRTKSPWTIALLLLLPLIVVLSLALGIGGRNLPCLECLAHLPEKGVSLHEVKEWAEVRGQIWLAVLELAKDQWLFGYGLGAYPSALTQLELPADSVLYIFNQAHNQYLNLLLDTGVVGLGLFLALLATAVVGGIRMVAQAETRERGLMLLWIAGSYAIFGVFEAFFSRAVSSMQFGVYMGFLMWTIPASQERPRDAIPAGSTEAGPVLRSTSNV